MRFTTSPISSAFMMVPTPGRWRNGIHSSNSRQPTISMTQPSDTPVWRAIPWWKTSHGASPSSAVTNMLMPRPNNASPTTQRASRWTGRSGERRNGTPSTLPTPLSHPPGTDSTMVLSMLSPSRCAACGSPGRSLCHGCRFALASVGQLRTPVGVVAAFPFDGVARELIVALKFRHRRAAAAVLATQMVRRLRLPPVDVVTWAPTSNRRVRGRGYDQAEVIARAVAKQLGVPCVRLLYRAHGAPQTGKSRSERLVGPAFRARRPRKGLAVLVVDDVVTTGATLLTAAEALLAAGVGRVELAAVASTQRRPPVGCLPAWASSIASSELVKARS